MSNVMPLRRPIRASAVEPETALYRRIRLGSRALVVLFTALAAAFVLAMTAAVVLLVYPNDLVRIGPSGTYLGLGGPGPTHTVAMGTLPLAHRLAFLPIALVRLAPSVAILWGLRRLFGLYARGIVFAAENARQIRFVGLWLAVDALVPFIEHLIQRGLGIEIDANWFHVVSLQELVLGALVFVIAEVMRVGHEIEQERAEFI
jgi:hypothetical protein